MNNELTQGGGGSLAPRPGTGRRTVNKQARAVIAKTQLAGLELDGLAALYGKAIERTVDVYDHADFLSQTRPELRPILMQQVFNFTQAAEKHIKNNDSPFGL